MDFYIIGIDSGMPARMAENYKLPWTLEMMCACSLPLGPKIPFVHFSPDRRDQKNYFQI